MRRPNARSQPPDPDPDPDPTAEMDPPKPPHHHLRPYLPPPPKRPPGSIYLLLSLIIALVLYLYIISRESSSIRYGIIIDAGSTGTRIHVFAYEASKRRGDIPAMDLRSAAAMKATPGLSAYSADPEAAGASLTELVEFGRGRVPRELWSETEVRLMATAGLRLLDGREQEGILEACRQVLRSSGFWFEDEWATVIPGSDEGMYAWVAANYAVGSLGGDPQNTIGIIELGGASAQVTFVPSEPLPPEFLHVLKFGETTYNLYSQSFLHLGQNVAYEALRKLLSSGFVKPSAESVQKGILRDPCTPKGYTIHMQSLELSVGAVSSKNEYDPVAHTVGNFTECRSAALTLLQKEKDKCLYQQCLVGSSFIPKLRGRFLATENFFYTSKFLGLGQTSFLSDLVSAGEQFCGEDWMTLKKKHHDLEEEDLVQYCFSSAYIVALLHDSLGIGMDEARIEFANQVGDVPLDWALGAFIMQQISNMSNKDSSWFASIFNTNPSALLSLLVVSAVLVFAAWSVPRWRKSRLKTIYDMEKGRYIIKHINR